MRRVAVVTVARSDYGIYRSLLRELSANAQIDLSLIVSGMHLSPEFGYSVRDVEADGYRIRDRIEMLVASDTPSAIATSIGLGTIGFAHAFQREQPDLLVVLGDRFEMFAAVSAALPFRIPIAHLHGGESTEGLIDEAIRHAISKMAHLHFVSTDAYAARVIQLGEEPWRVEVSGAPGLDDLDTQSLDQKTLSERVGLDLASPTLVVTYHPVTLEQNRAERNVGEMLGALDMVGANVLFTLPNADTEGRVVIDAIERYVSTHGNARLVANLGTAAYFGVMRLAAAMVGNSSSGIIEAPSFGLPVVNIGARQQGRVRGANVIDVGDDRNEIAAAIRRAMSADFRRAAQAAPNPYVAPASDGRSAGRRIADRIASVDLNEGLLRKRFHEVRG